MLFLYLFLGHLVADYLLQPSSLVAWKHRSLNGVAVHASIHVLVTTLLLYLYSGRAEVFFVALLIGIMHFFIDSIKASHDQKSKHPKIAYWVDQCAHYLSLVIGLIVATQFPDYFVNRVFSDTSFAQAAFVLLFNPLNVAYYSLAIFSTFTIEYSYYKDRSKGGSKGSILNHRRMLERLFLTTLIFLGLVFSFIPSVGLYY